MAIKPIHTLLTVDDYYQLVEDGILRQDDRVELIEGRIIEMPPIGPEHADTVETIADAIRARLHGRFRVRTQYLIRLDNSSGAGACNVAVVRRDSERARPYRVAHPEPIDVRLVVEVSDSTLNFDLGTKARLYALAGILDFWVVDLLGDRVVVHREPTPEGYASIEVVERGGSVSPLAFPDLTFTSDEILG